LAVTPRIRTPWRGEAAPVVTGSEPSPTVLFAGGGTGGHLYPALAIARTLERLAPNVRSVFVGARRGIERDVLPQQGFRYELLDLHPLYRPAFWRNWRTIWGGVGAWRDLGALARREHPRLVVGTGGYASGAALAYAVAHRIPVVEQIADSTPGLTARWFARYSREVYVGYPESIARLPQRPGTVYIDTGNPIEPPPTALPDRARARAAWDFPNDGSPVILVFGGSQGARAINSVVDSWVAGGLPSGIKLIWATGRAQFPDYAGREGPGVRVRPYLAPIAEAYAAADIAVTRAGAMTTAELCAWGIPMVLVPLPTAAADHQTANARALEAAGAAIRLSQDVLSVDSLSDVADQLVNDPGRRDALAAGARLRARPSAAEDIARRILSMVDLR
jgi:UDP-N-acetylglucosamine--N-acetylmuramyl-(pentapeptide) pyrophosphoryl-undecaprenol N-acetylglucosamine transferase